MSDKTLTGIIFQTKFFRHALNEHVVLKIKMLTQEKKIKTDGNTKMIWKVCCTLRVN